MIQSFHTQLEVTMRALREVVAPAVDAGNKQVVEQLQLSIATLAFMQQRLPYARRYYRMELQHLLDTAQELAAVVVSTQAATAAALRGAIDQGRGELLRPEAEIEDYQIVARQLRELMSGAVAASAGSACEAQLDALVLRSVEFLLLRERVWCLPLGFELQPEALPDLDALLGD